MKFLSTLQRTLSLHFLAVAFLPSLLFGLIAIALLHKHLEAGIYQRNQLLSQDIAIATEQFLLEVESDMGLVANTVEDGMIVSAGALDAYLQAFIQHSGRFESVFLLDHRRHVINLGLDPRIGLDRDDYRDVDFSQHALFQRNTVIDRAVWSDTFISLTTGEPAVSLAIPVKTGMLFGNINLQSLNLHLARFAMEGQDSCAVLDRTGTMVASSDPKLSKQRVNFKDHRIVDLNLAGQGATRLESRDNQLYLESVTGIPRTGWIAWVGSDMGAKMAPVRHIRNILVGTMVMALLMAASLALLDARRLMLPLAILSERAGKIGQGDYAFHFHHSGFAEIDSLADSLQAMSIAVGDRERSITASEERFRNLVNSIDGVVWEMDIATCRYLFVSRQLQKMLGYEPEQLLNDPDFLVQCVHPEDRERVMIRGRRSLALGEKHDLEYRLFRADGGTIWIRDLVTVAWEGDEPRRLLGVMVDVTNKKLAQIELTDYRLHLEELVAQRTRELQKAQSELVQKERLAVLGQLTATVSHEIRNPLGTVSNVLFLLRETLGKTCMHKVERPLALAERSVQRCDGIISELLDFTKQRELRRAPVQLDAWLAETLEEATWPENVRLTTHLTSGVTVQADPDRLRRALVNVITNALQAMEEQAGGENALDVRTRRLADRCEIVVQDTGAGISPQNLARIFEPLFSTKSFGVGLGVPIIRNIMADHGGGVEYASEVGRGTTVTLWLPLPGLVEATEA